MATMENRVMVREGKGLNPKKYFYTTFPISNLTDGKEAGNFTEHICGELGYALYLSLMAIPGVRKMRMSKYYLLVSKFEAYKWGEIYPHMLSAIEEVFSETKFKLDEENAIELALKRFLSKLRSVFS